MTVRITAVLFILLVIGVLITSAIKNGAPASLCDNLRCINFSQINTFTRKEIYADTPDTYRALYTSPSRTLRIEARKIAPDQSAAELTAAVTRHKALFEKAPAPYPGEISDAIICDPDYIPHYNEATSTAGIPIWYFTGYLNDRLTFGSCSKNQAVNKGILAHLYCPQNTLLIKLELIQPTTAFEAAGEETESLVLSVNCTE